MKRKTPTRYLAIDLGAESGRLILGTLNSNRIEIKELHRFPNHTLSLNQTLRWDLPHLLREIQLGLFKAGKLGLPITSISTDSWGVDYVYSTSEESLLSLPFHYRDARNEKFMRRALKQLSPWAIYKETGIQFMNFNTLFQLYADSVHRPQIHQVANRFLGIADFVNFWLSGVPASEESLASTTQLCVQNQRRWCKKLIRTYKLNSKVFPKIIESGSVLGSLKPEFQTHPSYKKTKITASLSHDTGAAIAAIPAKGKTWAYLSCGTWSLLGLELAKPIVTRETMEMGFTNEKGLGGTSRFLKNIVGLWILQECRRTWHDQGRSYDYEQLTKMAALAPAHTFMIRPDDPRFATPGGMPEKIAKFCHETGQRAPKTVAQTVRGVLESLALFYQLTLDSAQKLTRRRLTTLHMVGGGCKNELLTQFTANATGLCVKCGPVEATSVGNLLTQALASGQISSHQELRTIVNHSFVIKTFKPENRQIWLKALERYRSLLP